MSRTTRMCLIELMTLSQDVGSVIEYIGSQGCFQFQSKKVNSDLEKKDVENPDKEILGELQRARSFLELPDLDGQLLSNKPACDDDRTMAVNLISAVKKLGEKIAVQAEELKRAESSYSEALSFSNLQVPFSELEHLSFLTLRIGKIPSGTIDGLVEAVGVHGMIIPLGDDETKILAASSKKSHFALDSELKKVGFVPLEIPKDFKGIPDDVLETMRVQRNQEEEKLSKLNEERKNFAETHSEMLYSLLKAFSMASQIKDIQNNLESTSLVYRITGWIPSSVSSEFIKGLDNLTEGRIAIREYLPTEVPSVLNGEEQVPVKLSHGKFITAFERMIFSYGSPLYGTIDPTPFVAVFFTILFGIMFGDFGQGLIFLIFGFLMALKLIKVGGWNKFAPIFMAIGCTSSIMGLLTGEFFGTEKALEPFAHFVTGLFGTPHAPILKVMPSSDPNSIMTIFGIFGVTIACGVIINSIGLVLNIINKMIQKKWGSALFGKSGLSGALFYWYVVAFALRLAFFGQSPKLYDWIVIAVTLFFSAFGEPFERIFDGHHPAVENGVGALLIGGVVELIEVVSSYLSSTISFVRVGAFALAHAVLGFIINMMAEKCGVAGGSVVLIAGNAIVVVLEGMIVAIQVIRLQYYEFFSKFFNETGTEFKPLRFSYQNN